MLSEVVGEQRYVVVATVAVIVCCCCVGVAIMFIEGGGGVAEVAPLPLGDVNRTGVWGLRDILGGTGCIVTCGNVVASEDSSVDTSCCWCSGVMFVAVTDSCSINKLDRVDCIQLRDNRAEAGEVAPERCTETVLTFPLPSQPLPLLLLIAPTLPLSTLSQLAPPPLLLLETTAVLTAVAVVVEEHCWDSCNALCRLLTAP